jgi:hypothetical protein
VAFPKLDTSYIHGMHNHSTAIGVPVILAALWVYLKAFKKATGRQSLWYILIAGVLYGYAALELETFFVISLLALLTMILVKLISVKWSYLGETFSIVLDKNFIRYTLILIIISLAMAGLQGGILTTIFHDTDRDHVSLVSSPSDFITLKLAPDPNHLDNPTTFIYLFSPDFFIQFGLPLLLIVPATIYFWKKRNGEALLLATIGWGALAVPFLFRYPSRNWELGRFFLLAIPIFSLLTGWYLMAKYELAVSKKLKSLIIIAVFFIGFTGVLSQLIFSVSSLDRFGQLGPLFMKPPEPTGLDIKAFQWIKANTTLQDRFFPYDPDFIRLTGRFTPGAYLYFTFNSRNVERGWYDQLVTNCSTDSIKFFKIDYFYVTPTFPINRLDSCLAKLDAQLVYEQKDGSDFRQIYRIDLL